MTTDEDPRMQALKRMRQRRDLGAHIVTYCVINAVLVGIWAISGAGYFWPAWVLIAWGVGVVHNLWDVCFRRPITEHDIRREIERLQR